MAGQSASVTVGGTVSLNTDETAGCGRFGGEKIGEVNTDAIILVVGGAADDLLEERLLLTFFLEVLVLFDLDLLDLPLDIALFEDLLDLNRFPLGISCQSFTTRELPSSCPLSLGYLIHELFTLLCCLCSQCSIPFKRLFLLEYFLLLVFPNLLVLDVLAFIDK